MIENAEEMKGKLEKGSGEIHPVDVKNLFFFFLCFIFSGLTQLLHKMVLIELF